MAVEFDQLAEDYDLLLPDDALTGQGVVQTVRALMPNDNGLIRVLDCASGVGIDAVALAAAGYKVAASDISPKMVEATRHRAASKGVEVDVVATPWRRLREHFSESSLDVVLCLGNSFVHCPTTQEKVESLASMRAILRPGGLLIIDSRNWDLLRPMGSRFAVSDRTVRRRGSDCITVRSWSIPTAWSDRHDVSMMFLLVDGDHVTTKHHKVSFYPIPHRTLADLVVEAGFDILADDFTPECEWYTVTGRVR